MKLKPGVDARGIKAELVLGLAIADSVHARLLPTYECVVTSLLEGKHKVGSLHPLGRAADLRTRDLGAIQIELFKSGLAEALGAQFDVVLEGDHIHMEFDPK